tara:strand:+ start:2832 stop:3287 length:456 start_codon:yes stop_codon:yes gene_type:complete
MNLEKTKSIDNLQQLMIDNNDKEGIYGDGKDVLDIKELPITHKFADQIYIRQMNMTKGQVVIGAIHKHLHAWFLMTGHVTINDNDKIVDYLAPCYTISEPGAHRVIYAHEDSIFVNVHKNPSNTRDIKKLEKEIVAINKKDYDKKFKQLKK